LAKVTIFDYFGKMKKPLLLTFTLLCLLLFAGRGLAQTPPTDSARLRNDSAKLTDTTTASVGTAKAGTDTTFKDDGIDPAGFMVFLILVGIIAGAAVIGAVVCGVILGGLFVLATAGILSASFLVGFYQRSVTAGFKTALLLACSLGGLLVGGGGFYGINRFFHLHFGTRTVLLAGAGGGLLGGLLLGLVVFVLIRGLLKLLKQKLAF
jgi:hypothetical protein